jgi:hypothetical protein
MVVVPREVGQWPVMIPLRAEFAAFSRHWIQPRSADLNLPGRGPSSRVRPGTWHRQSISAGLIHAFEPVIAL